MRITLRLNAQEAEKLERIRNSAQRGDLTTSKVLRLLIHREYNRRQGIEKPKVKDYDSTFRNGRPKETV